MKTHRPREENSVYRYCECGAVSIKTQNRWGPWHHCDLCDTGAACTVEDVNENEKFQRRS